MAVIVLLLVTFCLCAIAQPRIDAGPDTLFDFGSVYQGASGTKQFFIHNLGNEVLHIEQVTSGCGCTTSELSSTMVPPRDSALVTVHFNSEHMLGPVKKRLLVVSNDTARRNYFLYYTARIVRVLEVVPEYIYFGSSTVGRREEKTVILKNTTGKTIRIIRAGSRSGLIEVSLSSMILAPGTSASLKAVFQPPVPAKFKDEIVVDLDDAEQKQIRISVVAMVSSNR